MGELTTIYLCDIEFSEDWSDEVSKLDDNRRCPIIVVETETGYRLQDGYGRVCGMINAGRETIHAILVDTDDLAERGTAAMDDPEWVAAMHSKYAPSSILAE